MTSSERTLALIELSDPFLPWVSEVIFFARLRERFAKKITSCTQGNPSQQSRQISHFRSHTSTLPLCVLAISTTTECSLAFILSTAMLELCRCGHCSCSSQKLCDVMDPGDPRQPSPGEWRCGGACAQGGSCFPGPSCEMVTLGYAIGDLLMPLVGVAMTPTLAQCGGDSGEGVLGECLFGGNEWCTCTTGA